MAPRLGPARKGVRCFAAGHKLLQRTGHLDSDARHHPRELLDYSYVVHDLQLNAWILAYRQHIGEALLEWHGETLIRPPRTPRQKQLAQQDEWTVAGLKEPAAKSVLPDAVLEIERPTGQVPWTLLVEHDRTRRVDKNYDKFRRYDTYLNAWHHTSSFARPGTDAAAPFVLFICQDEQQRQLFMHAADHELTGHRQYLAGLNECEHLGRRCVLFAVELDIHEGTLDAARLPPLPPGHPERTQASSRVRRVRLPGATKQTPIETPSALQLETSEEGASSGTVKA